MVRVGGEMVRAAVSLPAWAGAWRPRSRVPRRLEAAAATATAAAEQQGACLLGRGLT